jgi:type IV secretion system protein VirD4
MRAGATGAKLSQELGTYAVKAYSEGDNSGSQRAFAQLFGSRSKGRNVNVHEIKRKLAEAHELAQDMRADEMIVIVRGAKPIRCSKPIYFRRPEINKLVERNRFVKEAA